MNQIHENSEEYIEAEVIESQPLSNESKNYDSYEQPYEPPKNSNTGCYMIAGCLFIFLVGLITIIGAILSYFTDILTSIF